MSLSFQKEKNKWAGCGFKVIRTPDVTVFQGETAGFILRATARCPAHDPPWLTAQAPTPHRAVRHIYPQLRRCVKFNEAFRLLWVNAVGWKSSAGVVRPAQSLFG